MFRKDLCDNEKSAEEVGIKSMRRGNEEKVVEDNEDKQEREW